MGAAELAALSSTAGTELRAIADGASPVGVFSRRSIEHVAVVIGALHEGIPFFNISPKAGVEQVAQMVRIAGARGLVIDNAAVLKLAARPELLSGITLLRLDEGPWSPAHEAMLGRLTRGAHVRTLPAPTGAGPLHANPPSHSEGASCFLFTSGSTGTPKCVAIGAADLGKRIATEAVAYGLGPHDRLLNVLPFSFDVGFNQLLSSLASAATLVLLNSWLAQDIVDAIRDEEITGISAVPAIWQTLFEHDEDEVRDALARLRYLTVSGGDLAPEALSRLRRLAPDASIFKTYGQTETFRSGMLLPHELEARPRSVGRPPAGVRVDVLGEDGALLGPDQLGQVVHSGVGTMLGYVGDDVGTRSKVVTIDGRRSVLTGDLGYVDSEGYLFLQGRMDRMLKVRGNRVYPEEVEAALREHPDVAEAVVVLVNGPTPRLVAAVVPAGGDLDRLEMRSFLARRLMAFMVPEEVVVTRVLPRTATGKVDFRATTELITDAVSSPAGLA